MRFPRFDEVGYPLNQTVPRVLGESTGAHPPGDCDERQHGVRPGMTQDLPREPQGAARPGKHRVRRCSLSGPAPESSRLREPGGSGDVHYAPAPRRGPRPLSFSARSSKALWQLIAITGPSRVYLSPRKSCAVAPTSGGVAVPVFPGLAELGRLGLRLHQGLVVMDEREDDEESAHLRRSG